MKDKTGHEERVDGNYHLAIMHWLHNHIYFVMSCLL